MTHVTCRLTAKNRDQLQNPMLTEHRVLELITVYGRALLGNPVWATYTCLHCISVGGGTHGGHAQSCVSVGHHVVVWRSTIEPRMAVTVFDY